VAKAMAYFEQSSEQVEDSRYFLSLLSSCQERGLLSVLADERKDPRAYFVLGMLKDDENLIEASAEFGFGYGQAEIGKRWMWKGGSFLEKGKFMLEQSVIQGNPHGLYEMGRYAMDQEMGRIYLEQSAAREWVNAERMLGSNLLRSEFGRISYNNPSIQGLRLIGLSLLHGNAPTKLRYSDWETLLADAEPSERFDISEVYYWCFAEMPSVETTPIFREKMLNLYLNWMHRVREAIYFLAWALKSVFFFSKDVTRLLLEAVYETRRDQVWHIDPEEGKVEKTLVSCYCSACRCHVYSQQKFYRCVVCDAGHGDLMVTGSNLSLYPSSQRLKNCIVLQLEKK
jgi:hypothetical protein